MFLVSFAFAGCPFKLMAQEGGNELLKAQSKFLDNPSLKDLPPSEGTSTVQGCKCKTACGATIEDGFNCDWCYTEGKCGTWSYVRMQYYDYCTYPIQKSYEDNTWDWKHNYLWKMITQDSGSGEYINKLDVVGESVQTTFDTNWDWMPAGRHKVIHSVGAMCQVKLDIQEEGYTGILEKGSQTGYFRFGSATDPVNEGINPGAGFKFLRTGVRSANWVMLDDPNHTNIKDWNMWNRNLTNHVSAFQGVQKAVAVKFGQVSNCVTKVGLSNLATYSQDGVKAENPVFPWELAMVPTGITMSGSKTSLEGFLAGIIDAIPKGTTFYNVMAKSSPFSGWKKIGTLTTIEDCVTSKYGDNQMFFQHQRIEEDWKQNDWWTTASGQITEKCGYAVTSLEPPPVCSKKTDFSEMC